MISTFVFISVWWYVTLLDDISVVTFQDFHDFYYMFSTSLFSELLINHGSDLSLAAHDFK